MRPIKLLPGVRSPLRDFDGGGIDYVVVRENTEKLYASRGEGVFLRGEMASVISDLGAATVGGMGISPSGEMGDERALFQGAHGSAPDIAGQNLASPLATVLSGSLMLRWLARRHDDPTLTEAADRIDAAVGRVLATGEAAPHDLGGTASCTEMTEAICRALAA